MSAFSSPMRFLRSSIALQLCAALAVEVIILLLLVWPLDQKQGYIGEDEWIFGGGSPAIIAAAIAFSLLTALLAARNVELRMQDLARRSERFALGDRAERIHEAWENELPAEDHGQDASLATVEGAGNSRKQAQQIASIGPWRYKPDEQTLFWSQETVDNAGLNPAEPAQCFGEFLSGLEPSQKATMVELFEDLKPGEERSFDLIVHQPDGTRRRCRVEARAEGQAERETLLIGTCQDIADGGAAAAQMHNALKVQAAGRTTRTLVHDLNNLLSTTVGNLDLLEEQLPETNPGRELVERALGAALRGAELGRQILELSRVQPPGLQTSSPSLQDHPAQVESGTEGAEPVEADGDMLPPNSIVVLVVEDEEDVRKTVERQLGELGYNVVCASNAAEAMGLLDDGFRVDLLFTDVVMDGDLDGVDLARQALEKKPKLKVLHTSGYMSASEQAGYEVKRLLTKPYRRSTLSSAIQSTLDDSSDEEFRL